MRRTEKVVEINAPVERVFDLFSDFESFPRWMSHIKDVRYTGRRYTRWTAEAPLGSSVEWEAETTRFEPDRLIAWRSVRGDVDTEGEVIFQETERGTTRVRVMLGYDPPAGRLGALVARLFGTNPEEQLEEDLERFAEVVEGRRRRGFERHGRDFVEDEPSRRSSGRRFEREARGYKEGARRREFEEDVPVDRRNERLTPRERERQTRFAQEVGEALRSQRESMRRYNEERRNHKLRRRREEYEREVERREPPRTGERAPAEERRLYERRMRERAPRRGEDDRRPAPHRHALTPREREMERARRKLDFEYAKRAFNRGVDKLLDEQDAPSSRWRR
ncbi:MAG TPA: SRPBCC family protein [Pyrinomonadaceae bacterium]|jgi:uncharacterized protein YndB with AHSA1/START domain